jgi:hypothetical protein
VSRPPSSGGVWAAYNSHGRQLHILIADLVKECHCWEGQCTKQLCSGGILHTPSIAY